MKTYYLQRGGDGRDFIDDYLHAGCDLKDKCQARNWLFARAKLAGIKWTEADQSAHEMACRKRWPLMYAQQG